MDVRSELEQDPRSSEGLERAAPASAAAPPASASPQARAAAKRQLLEEASFLVVESGRIRFFVRPRVAGEAPTGLDHVERLSFTLAPRNREVVRCIALCERQLPDSRVRDRKSAHVVRVGAAEAARSDVGARRRSRRGRGPREHAGAVEVARGTYAITSHRDHAHLMYELDAETSASSGALVRQLGIAPRASYVALVQNPESRWRVSDHESPGHTACDAPCRRAAGRLDDDLDKRRFMPLDPVFLDHEGTELVLIGGRAESEPRGACVRS